MARRWRIAAPVVAALLLLALLPGLASAHERRQVGPYTFIVGFLNEPAIVDQPNGIDLTVMDSNNKPVEGLEKTLKAQIIYGGSTQDATLQPRFNQPGKYAAYFIPTRTGTWKFHFTGTINGQNIDEMFTSGPGRFNDVQSTESLDFPEKTPDLVTMNAQVSSAKSAADSAKTIGIVGIVVGAIGLAAGAAGLGIGLLARRAARQREAASGATGRAVPGAQA